MVGGWGHPIVVDDPSKITLKLIDEEAVPPCESYGTYVLDSESS